MALLTIKSYKNCTRTAIAYHPFKISVIVIAARFLSTVPTISVASARRRSQICHQRLDKPGTLGELHKNGFY